MSNDEKKYNIDDILAEYDKAGETTGDAVSSDEAEKITGGGTDLDEAGEMTDDGIVSYETAETTDDGIDSDEAAEIITDDGIDDEDETEDYPEDILEPVEDIEDSDIPAEMLWDDVIVSEIPEDIAVGEAAEEMTEMIGETPEEITETEKNEAEIKEAETEEADTETTETETKEIEETARSEAAETTEETATEVKTEIKEMKPETEEISNKKNISQSEEADVNEKWITRFLKGIFPIKGDSVFEIIRKIIFLAAVTVFIGAGVMLASTLIQSKKAVSDQSEARSLIETTVATYIDEYGNTVTIPPTDEEIAEHNRHIAELFRQINKDYIGYLEIDGCDIYEPVVKGEDNEYYLRHTLKGEYNKAGAIFMDHRCTVTAEYTSPNIVIYGHNQEDGTMFGRLKYYKENVDFYSQHPVIRFNPEFENSEYLIYGFFVTNALENQDSNGEVFHYHDYIEAMNDIYTFDWYQREVQSRNQIISPVDVKFGDKLLCLSTCSTEYTNSRFVVFARKLRDGESVSDYDFSETRLNPNARGIDWGAVLSGETSSLPDEDDTIEETTWKKSLNKRNEKTVTAAETETSSETEKETKKKTTAKVTEKVTTTTVSETESETVTTVPETAADGETLTETGGSTEETS